MMVKFDVYYYKIKEIDEETLLLELEEEMEEEIEEYDTDLGYWEEDNTHRPWYGYKLKNSEEIYFEITEFFDKGYFIVEINHDEEYPNEKILKIEEIIKRYSNETVIKHFE